ncbi:MAG: HAD family hydrolase [Bacillota bacterium]
MIKIIEAVIFDMDGVIIDSEPLHYEVNQEIFEELKINIDKKEYSRYIGVSNTEMWKDIIKRYKLNYSLKELVEIQKQKNLQHLKQGKLNTVPGVNKLIKNLHNRNIKLALASSSPPELIETALKLFNLGKYFSVIESGENVKNGKPEPDIFLKTASLLNINKNNIIIIEDSHNGVLAANKAGIKCVGFKNENSGNQDLSKADFIIDNFDQFRNILFDLNS